MHVLTVAFAAIQKNADLQNFPCTIEYLYSKNPDYFKYRSKYGSSTIQ